MGMLFAELRTSVRDDQLPSKFTFQLTNNNSKSIFIIRTNTLLTFSERNDEFDDVSVMKLLENEGSFRVDHCKFLRQLPQFFLF